MTAGCNSNPAIGHGMIAADLPGIWRCSQIKGPAASLTLVEKSRITGP